MKKMKNRKIVAVQLILLIAVGWKRLIASSGVSNEVT